MDPKLLAQRASFSKMSEGTAEDYVITRAHAMKHFTGHVDRVVAHLSLLKDISLGYAISRYEHCLQAATRAQRDGRDDEYVVCALLHDVGDSLGCLNHADIATAVLEPWISEDRLWMVKHHAIFQGRYFFHHYGLDRDMRDQFKDHPMYGATAEFCALYDENCFDKDYEAEPIEHFLPTLRKVFSRPLRSIYLPKPAS